MRSFIHELHLISDLTQLVDLKEQIKQQVMEKELNWQYRMNLYRKVQLINERIVQLEEEKVV
ncbi:hypothetical protein [Ammoniphilus sp. CFH 90114]|uniref:hypothetical protein n=1 Tax=Ammoniphilus sp. CFH 90114 TaxID=2493665 RepID=UPI00100EC091|nr:hypothetical protein [Ammoniphilus sp. CFH 90114]RXT06255.1 hypothetical protein EIZ39_14295 [Ammoniphilus sp. CFH 90114]